MSDQPTLSVRQLGDPTDAVTALLERVRTRRDLPSPEERKATREASGETQGACAAACGVTRSAFARWESGERQPVGEHLFAYSKLLRGLQDLVAGAERLAS